MPLAGELEVKKGVLAGLTRERGAQIAGAGGMEYGALCEAILDGAALHAGLPSRKPQEARSSHVALSEIGEESEPLRAASR